MRGLEHQPEMTTTRKIMALIELIEKGGDSDLVREMLASAAERMMGAEVEVRTGAASAAVAAGSDGATRPWTSIRPQYDVGCCRRSRAGDHAEGGAG